jgi:four helix bundle protein
MFIDGNGNVDLDPTFDSRLAPVTQPRPRNGRLIDMLSFQRLDVYQRAIEFLALVTDIIADLPKGHSERADQLARAAESVVRNIAEGAGRWSKADCTKHYKIARGEAMECAASLDVMKVRNVIAADRYDRGIRLLEGEVAMLTKML